MQQKTKFYTFVVEESYPTMPMIAKLFIISVSAIWSGGVVYSRLYGQKKIIVVKSNMFFELDILVRIVQLMCK